MSELSGLELRKAVCEALGWRFEVQIAAVKRAHGEVAAIGYFHSPKCAVDRCDYPSHKTLETLPAIESDPAVSEPMFLEWLSANSLHAEMSIRSDGEACLEIKCFQNGGLTTRRVTMQFGSNPSEARARAILAASRKE